MSMQLKIREMDKAVSAIMDSLEREEWTPEDADHVMAVFQDALDRMNAFAERVKR